MSPTLHTPGVLGQQNSFRSGNRSLFRGSNFVPLRQPVDMLSGQQKSPGRGIVESISALQASRGGQSVLGQSILVASV